MVPFQFVCNARMNRGGARRSPDGASALRRRQIVAVEELQARPLLGPDPHTAGSELSVAEVVPGYMPHPFDRLEVQFNEPVRGASFTLDEVSS